MKTRKFGLMITLGLLVSACTFDNEEDLGIGQPGNITREERVISFSTEIRPIVDLDCNIPECHNGEDRDIPDFSKDAEIKNNSNEIRVEVLAGRMPFGRTLTFEDKNVLISWINQGAELN